MLWVYLFLWERFSTNEAVKLTIVLSWSVLKITTLISFSLLDESFFINSPIVRTNVRATSSLG